MKKNKNWEGLIAIIIWFIIISFILILLSSNMMLNTEINDKYESTQNENILKYNTQIILNKLDLSNISNWEDFYLYKDKTSQEYKIKTWSTNENLKFINNVWDNINPELDKEKIYIRKLINKGNILKLNPEKIEQYIEYNNIDINIKKLNKS